MSSRDLRPIHAPAGGRSIARADETTDDVRERVVHTLGVHFANDDLALDELDRRLTLAFRTPSAAGLIELIADLPPLGPDLEPAPVLPPYVDAASMPERGVLAAVMGGNIRKGSWLVPRYLKVIAVMGAAVLDLRQARFAPGVTDIEVLAVMGGVEVFLPPGVRVELMGVAIMGGFETSAGDEKALDPAQPVVRISGLAFMAGVEARTKRPSAKALNKFRTKLRAVRKRSSKESE